MKSIEATPRGPARSTGRGVPRVNILGVGVSAIDMDQAIAAIDAWVAGGVRRYVCVTNIHGVMESQWDERIRRIHSAAGLVTPDGMPLVWLCRLRGFRHVRRVYGPDLMLAVCARSVDKGWRHFFYGGSPGVPELLASRLGRRFPGLRVVGTYSPAFRSLTPDEDEQIVRMVNDARPDIVWVGLGTPKQERWMAEHTGRLSAPVLVGVGAAFDFHAGRKPQAPRWMQTCGLEWLFRLVTEPRRLWRRYSVVIPSFLWATMLQSLRLKTYRLD